MRDDADWAAVRFGRSQSLGVQVPDSLGDTPWLHPVRLSPREHLVLQLIGRAYPNKRIARNLGIAPETVKSHAKSIFVKLGARSRIEAVVRALMLGLI
jgi:DNA-binding NarL/FixJ family response regulator